MSPLLEMPLEVLLQITSYLTTPEYGHLRSTCSQLEAALFGAFSKEFFSKRMFALIDFSIQALVDIAKSRLGPSITHLIIHLEHPYNIPSPVSPPLVESAVRENRSMAASLDHVEFITTGLDAEMLSDALSRLPNLETIGMRDFHPITRSRDNTAWHSYGCPTFARSHDLTLELPLRGVRDRGPEYTSHVFLTILRAIGKAAVSSHSSKITRMEILLHHCRLTDQSFKIPNRLEAEISLALSKLTTIFLDGLDGGIPCVYVNDRSVNHDPTIGVGYFLSRFLTRASALEHLRLNFQFCTRESILRLLEWLGSGTDDLTSTSTNEQDPLASANVSGFLPAHFPPAPRFSNLQYFDIGMANLSEKVLLDLCKTYKSTLRSISLHKCMLEGRKDAQPSSWAGFCQSLADSDLELKILRLSHLRQKAPPAGTSAVRYGRVTFKESKDRHTKIWSGGALSQAIRDIVDDMEVSWDGD
ncbi:hypothetical protein F4777DRAFT_477864 [Nemania sp. FL0916]|nr:hypothetical protein F4777DRAFT_477864 [Nemania sp. FL0916]